MLAGVPDFMAALSVLFQAGILEPAARLFCACLLRMPDAEVRCMHACLGIACSAVRLERVLCVLHVSAVVRKSSVLACVHTVGRACAVCRVSCRARSTRVARVGHVLLLPRAHVVDLSVCTRGWSWDAWHAWRRRERCVCAMQRMLCYVMLSHQGAPHTRPATPHALGSQHERPSPREPLSLKYQPARCVSTPRRGWLPQRA